MTHPFGHPEFFGQGFEGMTAFQITPSSGIKRVFVVTFDGGPHPRMVRREERFDDPTTMYSLPEPQRETERAYLSAIPRNLSRPTQNTSSETLEKDTFCVRPIQGTLVQDASGKFFEAIGQQLRPLRQLVRGAQGELLELLPRPSENQNYEFRPQANVADTPADKESEGDSPAPKIRAAASQRSASPATGFRPDLPPFRKLLAEPGIARVVALEDFRSMLSPQLMHPERVRDSHRLRCFVLVFEATRPQPLAAFIEAIQGDDPSSAPLQPLSDSLAVRLELTGILPARPSAVRQMRRESGFVLPYDRFFRMVVSGDPTEDQQTSAERCEPEISGAAPTAAETCAAPKEPKTAIPEEFQKPWEFKFSRDEVLYDMNCAELSRGTLRSIWDKTKNRLAGDGEMRKWQALLCGKTPDEQLWAVRPPLGSFDRVAIRGWVQRTLEQAGYEPHRMLLEWEIFWRRKGL